MRTLEKFASDLQKASSGELTLRLKLLLAVMAIQGESFAKRNYGVNGLGVVTGRLKQSITGRALTGDQGIGIVLTAGDRMVVKYAATHEFGDPEKGIIARPYIAPAIEHLKRRLPDNLKKVVQTAILDRPFSI